MLGFAYERQNYALALTWLPKKLRHNSSSRSHLFLIFISHPPNESVTVSLTPVCLFCPFSAKIQSDRRASNVGRTIFFLKDFYQFMFCEMQLISTFNINIDIDCQQHSKWVRIKLIIPVYFSFVSALFTEETLALTWRQKKRECSELCVCV